MAGITFYAAVEQWAHLRDRTRIPSLSVLITHRNSEEAYIE